MVLVERRFVFLLYSLALFLNNYVTFFKRSFFHLSFSPFSKMSHILWKLFCNKTFLDKLQNSLTGIAHYFRNTIKQNRKNQPFQIQASDAIFRQNRYIFFLTRVGGNLLISFFFFLLQFKTTHLFSTSAIFHFFLFNKLINFRSYLLLNITVESKTRPNCSAFVNEMNLTKLTRSLCLWS